MGHFVLEDFRLIESLAACWLSRLPLTAGVTTEPGVPLENSLEKVFDPLIAALSSSAFAAQLFKDGTGTDINTSANWSTVDGATEPGSRVLRHSRPTPLQ
jgi:hypothetical protein